MIAVKRTVAVALAALGCGFVVPAVDAAPAGPVKGALYKAVDDIYPLSFRVSANGRSVDSLVAGIESTCVPGPTVAPDYHFPAIAIKGDSFAGKLEVKQSKQSKQSATLEVSGRFKGKTASGKLVETLKIKSLHTCTSTIDFTAATK